MFTQVKCLSLTWNCICICGWHRVIKMFHLILVFHDQNNMTLKVIVELHLAYSYSTFSFFSSVLLTCPLFIAFFWLTTATEYPSGFFSDLRLLNTPLVSFLTYGYWIPLWFLFWLTATEYPSGFFSDLRLLNTPLVSSLVLIYILYI
jgi:hypothetical protein